MREQGLTTAEAAARLARFGPNRFERTSRWQRVRDALEPFTDPMAIMLAVAAATYWALGEKRDAVILLVALVPVLGIDVLLERRSHSALAKLAAAIAPRARVIRDGNEIEIDRESLVPGDVLMLREGFVVHADGRLLASSNVSIDESALTGESEPQDKRAARDGDGPAEASTRFFAGTTVVTGSGFGEITETGAHTRYGSIASLVGSTHETLSPLQRQTRRMVRGIAIVAAVFAAAVFAIALARGSSTREAFLSAVSLAMASIPEEFPLVFTLFLSLGALRLSRRGVLVRRLASVETLGSTAVICTDKTGTLTLGRFEMVEHVAIPQGNDDASLLATAVLACEAAPADAMERAIALHCVEHGAEFDAIQRDHELLRDHPFDPVGKHMSHVWRRRDDPTRMVVVAKGAIEGVLEHCAIDDATRARALALHTEMAARGLRLLALASREFQAGGPTRREDDERDLRLVGLLGFRDPLRPEVPAAIRACREAGIAVKIVTGDHAITAHAIATAAGLAIGARGVVTGDEFDRLSPRERAERAREADVFARVRPEQKFAIVESLRQRGEIVAMTGDGINDAPALRVADIGVAMGKRGTDVARAAAAITLLEDDFAAIVETIREGRRIFANIQRAFLYLIAFHVPIVALALVVPIAGAPLLLMPVHLVWLELVVHPVSAIAFEAEPPSDDPMRRPPRRPSEPLLSLRSVVLSVATGASLTAAVAAVYFTHLARGVERARGLALVALVMGYVLVAFVERAGGATWRTVLSALSRRFVVVHAFVVASLPFVIQTGVSRAFHVDPLALRDWLLGAAVGLASVSWRLVVRGSGR